MTSKSDLQNILIIAAEDSSVLYARRLLEHWQSENKNISAFGIGDSAMVEMGFTALGRSEDMAVVGLQEVLAHWSEISATFHKVVDACVERKPKVALLLDYPGFNLRLAKKLKELGIPVVYYISPQIWAWKKGRIKTIQKYVDKMLVLFPFEEEFYQKYDVDVEFVGHPLLDELEAHQLSESQRSEQRKKYGIADEHTVLALMPGSRQSELKHHLEAQLGAARELCLKKPDLKVALFVAPSFSIEEMKEKLQGLQFSVILVKDEPFRMIQMADVILCASGTATLMVGLMQKPMVIMYRMHPVTAWIARRLVTATKYFGMANLILDEEVAPEHFQEEALPKPLAKALWPLVNDSKEREKMRERWKNLQTSLGDKGATKRVAKSLEGYIS